MTDEFRRYRAPSPWPYRLGVSVAIVGTAFVANRLSVALFGGVRSDRPTAAEARESKESQARTSMFMAASGALERRGRQAPERSELPTEMEVAQPPLGKQQATTNSDSLADSDGLADSDSLTESVFVKDSTSTEVIINEAYLPQAPVPPDSREQESEADVRVRKSALGEGTSGAWQHDGTPVARGLRLLANDAARKSEPVGSVKDDAVPESEPMGSVKDDTVPESEPVGSVKDDTVPESEPMGSVKDDTLLESEPMGSVKDDAE